MKKILLNLHYSQPELGTIREFLVEEGLIDEQPSNQSYNILANQSFLSGLDYGQQIKEIWKEKTENLQPKDDHNIKSKSNTSISNKNVQNVQKMVNISEIIHCNPPKSNIKIDNKQRPIHKDNNHQSNEATTKIVYQNKIISKSQKVSSKQILPIKQNTSDKKIPNNKLQKQLHIKINIFNQHLSKNNHKIPIILFLQQSSKCYHLTHHTSHQKIILFFDLFWLFQPAQSNHHQIRDKLINNQYIVCQNYQQKVYISTLSLKHEYRIVRALQLHTTIKTILFLHNKKYCKKYGGMNNFNVKCQHQINKEEVICNNLEDQCIYGTLYLGCNNGCIYAIKVNDNLLKSQNNVQLENIISIKTNVQNSKQSDQWHQTKVQQPGNQIKQTISITKIIPHHSNSNILYVIVNNKQLKIFHRQLIQQASIGTKFKYIEKQINEQQPHKTISCNITISVLKYIDIYKQNQQKDKCLIILINGMHAPCILDKQQIDVWFPHQLQQLINNFNIYWDQQNIETEPHQQKKQSNQLNNSNNCPDVESQIIKGISCIQYQQKYNNLVIGCNDGKIYFGKIQSSKGNHHFNQNGLNQLLSFNYLFYPHFVIQQSNSILSLALLQNQPYICISSQNKIIFYNILHRNKFSQNLLQKHCSVINYLKWTANQHLLLCALNTDQGRVYLYTNELPIQSQRNQTNCV